MGSLPDEAASALMDIHLKGRPQIPEIVKLVFATSASLHLACQRRGPPKPRQPSRRK
jgi:hypothetical protein